MSARSASDSRSSSASSRRCRSALLQAPPLNLALHGVPAPRAARPPARRRRAPSAPRPSPVRAQRPSGHLSGAEHSHLSGNAQFRGDSRAFYGSSTSPDCFSISPMRVPSPTDDGEPISSADEHGIKFLRPKYISPVPPFTQRQEIFYCDITDRPEHGITPLHENNVDVYDANKINDCPPTIIKYARGHSALPSYRPPFFDNYNNLLSRTKSLPSVDNISCSLSYKCDEHKEFDIDSSVTKSVLYKDYSAPYSGIYKHSTHVKSPRAKDEEASCSQNWAYDLDNKFIANSSTNLSPTLELSSKSNVIHCREAIANEMHFPTETKENITNHRSIHEDRTKSHKLSLHPDKLDSQVSKERTYNPTDYNENQTDKSLTNISKVCNGKHNSAHHVRFDVDSCEGMNSDDCRKTFNTGDKCYDKSYESTLKKLNIPLVQQNIIKHQDIYFKNFETSPSKESITDNVSCSSNDNVHNSRLCISDKVKNDHSISTSTLVVGSGGDSLSKNFDECLHTGDKTLGKTDTFHKGSGKINVISTDHSSVSPKPFKEKTQSFINGPITTKSSEIRSSYLKTEQQSQAVDTVLSNSITKTEPKFVDLIPVFDKSKSEADHRMNYGNNRISRKSSLCESEPADFPNYMNLQKRDSMILQLKKPVSESNLACNKDNYKTCFHEYSIDLPKQEMLGHNHLLNSKIVDMINLTNKQISELNYDYKHSLFDQERKTSNASDKEFSISQAYSTNSKFTKVECNQSVPSSPDLKLPLQELKDAAHYAHQLATVLDRIIHKHSQVKCSSRDCTSQQFEASYLSDVTWEEYSDDDWCQQEKYSSGAADDSSNLPNNDTMAIHAVVSDKEGKGHLGEIDERILLQPQQLSLKNDKHLQKDHQALSNSAVKYHGLWNVETKLFPCQEHKESSTQIEIHNKTQSNFKQDQLRNDQMNSSNYIFNSCLSPNSDRCHCCGPRVLHLSPEMLRQQKASLKAAAKVIEERKMSVNISLHQDVTEALKNAIQHRREAILPSDDATCATSCSMSEWSV